MNQRVWTRLFYVWMFCLGFVLSSSTYLDREAFGDERPINPDITSDTIELLSYQDSGYKFQIISSDATPPSGFERPGFDDTTFNTGNAAFGSGGECPLQSTVQRPWPVNSQLLVRRVVSIPAGATDVRIMVPVDNDIIGVFFDGMPLVEQTLGTRSAIHDGCPILDEFRFDVPQSQVQPGEHLVAFHVVDRGVESFFDARILATRLIPGVSTPLRSLPPLRAIPRVYIDEKDTPGLANADRKLVLNVALDNLGPDPKTLALCPMLHVHAPGEPAEPGVVLKITANGGQDVDESVNQDFDDDGVKDGPGVYSHARTFRFPSPLPIPFTARPNSRALITYSAKLSEFRPPLSEFTRAQIRGKLLQHERVIGSTLYIDYFFNFQNTPQTFNFQCPHDPNVWWNGTIDLPNYPGLPPPPCDPQRHFCADFNWFDFTITNALSTLTLPITIHTSDTARALIDGRPASAFIEVVPHCFLVECPAVPGVGGSSGLPAVVWTTDPAPGKVFVIDELEKVGTMVLNAPSGKLPEGAVIHFTVTMKEASSGLILSTETKRLAQDTRPPTILSFDITENGEGSLFASATVQDEAASIDFVELLVSRDGGQSFGGFPMDWKSGDFLTPTLFEATFSPLEPGTTIVKIRIVDEAGNSSETPPREVVARLPVCDIDGDSVVDRADIEAIVAARNTPAEPGDLRDVDHDGTITVNDARICTLSCTKPRCAP